MIALGARAGAAGPRVPEEPLEPGDGLLERLLADGAPRPHRIEAGLVHARGEQAGESPVRYRLGHIEHGLPTLLPGEVHAGLGVSVP